MTDETHSVRVTIFGHEYAIRGEANGEYIRELAGYVNGKMDEVARTSGVTLPLRVSILAAINLADEVFRLRNAKGGKLDPDAAAQTIIAPEAVSALAAHIEDALKEQQD